MKEQLQVAPPRPILPGFSPGPVSYTLFLFAAPVTLALLAWIGRRAWREREIPEARAILGLVAACAWWTFWALAEMMAPTFALSRASVQLLYVGVPWVPVMWLAFALSFTGRASVLRSAPFRLLVAFAAATGVVGLTIPWHDWIWTSAVPVHAGPFRDHAVTYGVWLWVLAGLSWVLGLGGSGLLLWTHARSRHSYRWLSLWLVLGAATPLLVSVLYVTKVLDLGKDPSPIGFGLGAVAFGMGVLRHRFLDLYPAARSALVDSMAEGLVALDEKDRVIDFNPALARLVGPDLHLGQRLAEALPALAAATARDAGEITLDAPGGPRRFDWRATPMSDLGRPQGRLVLLHDVTARRAAEDALRVALAELEARNEELDAFAHTAAHDLKNPIHTIRGYAEVLRDEGDDLEPEVRAESVAAIYRTADAMNAIVQELLLLASLRQAEVEPRPVEMGRVVEAALDRLHRPLRQSGAVVERPPRWPAALGYGPWIEEVWANYLSNAVKYGGPSPHIRLGAEGVAGGAVRFWVEDDGPGLAPEHAAQAFAPFQRFHPSVAEGHGLGLSVVARIMARLGGAVGVESATGQGARFWFELPAVPEAHPVVWPVAPYAAA